MRHRTLKLGLVAATALAAALPSLAIQPAYADYAPAKGDVVGAGSDSLQYMLDFVADGDAYGDTGYNQVGNKNKLVSFDSTADANARLAYGVDGGQVGQSTCSPGTGSVAGTANSTSYPNGTFTTSGAPCVLNPTIVLRAGSQPVQRPNGSGAGYKALAQDDFAGNNGLTSATPEVINFARASATQTEPSGLPQKLDAVEVASDTLPILAATTTNAVGLSATQLASIYGANTGGCVTWNTVGGTSTDQIVPLIPPPGSGIRTFFLAQIGLTAPGTCTVVAEQNDPTAIADQSKPADAIEPISQGRLDLYRGVNNTGTSGGIGNYFLDPSCAYLSGTSTCGSGSVTGGTWTTNGVAPAVKTLTGFDPTQLLYVYFRNSDITSTTPFQNTGPENWLNTLFYDPCESGQTCVTQGGVTYGPDGPPYIDQLEGQTLLEDAGVTPINTDVPSSFIAG